MKPKKQIPQPKLPESLRKLWLRYFSNTEPQDAPDPRLVNPTVIKLHSK